MKETTAKKVSVGVLFLSAVVIVLLYLQGHISFHLKPGPQVEGGEPGDFFKGSEIRLVVPNNPGGGYDDYARLLSGFLETYTGARVRLVNLPGAGGMRALGELYRAPADGLTLGLINGSGVAFNRVAGTQQMDFDISALSLLGRVSRDVRVLVVATDGKFASFEDLLEPPRAIRFGATGFGGSTYADAMISRKMFALDARVIHGFNNSSAIRLAMLNGKIDAAWSAWGSVADEVLAGRFRAILQLGESRSPVLADVPTALEYRAQVSATGMLEERFRAWSKLHEVGRPMAAPPDIAPERLAFLREAFRLAMQDPSLQNLAAEAGRSLDYASAEEVEAYFANVMLLPAEIQDYFADSMRGEL